MLNTVINRALLTLLLVVPLSGMTIIQNDMPVPLFDGRANASAFVDVGSEGATCTPTNVTFVEDPASSGKYAAELDGASGNISCGTGVDGLYNTGTRSIYIRPDTIGETAGFVYAKGTDVSNRSWQLLLDPDASSTCIDGTGDCFQLGISNTTNSIRQHDTKSGTVTYAGDYIYIAYVVICTSTTVESCDGTSIYINGQLVTKTNGPATGTIRTADSGDTFMIGNRPADDRTFDGKIKRTVVYTEELNFLQVERDYIETLSIDTPEVGSEAITLTDCAVLMASYNLAADQADLFERAPGDTQEGDGCSVSPGVVTQ